MEIQDQYHNSVPYVHDDVSMYCCGLNRRMESAGTLYAEVRMVPTVPKISLTLNSMIPLPTTCSVWLSTFNSEKSDIE